MINFVTFERSFQSLYKLNAYHKLDLIRKLRILQHKSYLHGLGGIQYNTLMYVMHFHFKAVIFAHAVEYRQDSRKGSEKKREKIK